MVTGRFTEPREVADLVVLLASGRAAVARVAPAATVAAPVATTASHRPLRASEMMPLAGLPW